MDFSKIWATNGSSTLPSDENYLEGFAFLEAAPPTAELFNALFKLIDQKLLSLYNTSNSWKAGAVYAVGDVVKSTTAGDYKLMECTVAGTSGTTEPTWSAVGANTTDNTVTWLVHDTRPGTTAYRLVALTSAGKLPAVDGSLLTNVYALASQAEAEAGTDNVKLMTALRVAQEIAALGCKIVDCSLTANGYITFQFNISGVLNKFTLQWGNSYVGGNTSATIAYPISFITTAYQGFAQNTSVVNNSDDNGTKVYELTTTNFKLYNRGIAGYFSWFIIGR